jgi:hypothetical protein
MGEAASRLLVEFKVMLPQDMFHLRNGAKQPLAAGAHRAVVDGPSAFCIMPMGFGKGSPSSNLQADPMSVRGTFETCSPILRMSVHPG